MKFNSLIPELSVADFPRSLSFYKDVLGFKIEYDRPLDKFAFLSFETIQIMIEEVNGNWETGQLVYPFGRGVNFQLEVSNVQSLVNNLKTAGIELFREVRDVRYEVGARYVVQRQFLVLDPDGYLLRFCQHL